MFQRTCFLPWCTCGVGWEGMGILLRPDGRHWRCRAHSRWCCRVTEGEGDAYGVWVSDSI